MGAKQKRSGPKPRGLVKKTIVMSKTREVAIVRAVAEGRAPSASGYIEQALAAYAMLESYDERAAVKRAAGRSERKVG